MMLTETGDYDLIFAALKNPIRREILLFLEEKGEASFTDIQNTLSMNDTGLLSYHLKELNLLVEQSSRGKYALSEIGQTSMALFRKVEREQQRTSKIVEKEIDSYVHKSLLNAVFWFILISVSLAVPLAVDITLSVQTIYETFPFWQMTALHVAGYAVMALCLAFFAIFDRHYYSKNQKTSIIHTTIFAAVTSALVLIAFITTYNFMQATLAVAGTANSAGGQWLATQPLMVILRTVAYVVSAPVVAYAINRLSKKR